METLPPVILGATILVPFGAGMLLRPALEKRWVLSVPDTRKPKRQLVLDFSICLTAGVFVAAFNGVAHGFPAGSGFSIIFGCMVFGLFIALDTSLARERSVIRAAAVRTQFSAPPNALYSMTKRFSFFAVTTIGAIALILSMVIARDFAWLSEGARLEVSVMKTYHTVLWELAFIMITLMFMVGNLIFSYSKNLRLLFNTETSVLEKVSQGNLSHMVPVITQDEFGFIAGHTNTMIRALRHRIQLLSSLEVAKEVQKSLLPAKAPVFEEIEIAGTSLYCDQTGGDYYDYFRLPNDRLGIVVADASDHGVGAALYMSTCRAFLKSAIDSYQSPEALLQQVNRILAEDSADTGRFMTLFFMEIDTKVRTLKWVRAGHEPGLIYEPAKSRFRLLSGPGVALGVDTGVLYQSEMQHGWMPGDILMIGTDGVREARNMNGEMFGMERVKTVVARSAAGPAATILEDLLGALEGFQADGTSDDDTTLVVLKLK